MNKIKFKKWWCYINLIRSIPAICAFHSTSEKNIIKADIEKWVNNFEIKYLNYPNWLYLIWFLVFYQEFRNLFYYRLKKGNNIIFRLIQIFYPPMSTLYINTDSIGEGFYIQHGFSTIISAKSIGRNCSVFQQVTIGYCGEENPIIEDNVVVSAGSIVIGGIRIGGDSIIGAGAVVTKSVPANCTVVGNPSYIIKKNGVKTKEYL